MKLLRSYTLKELLVPFCLAFLIFTFIFIVGNMVKMADLIINKGVSILDVMRVMVLLIPRLISFTIPTSALTAILLVFGGMAQNYEIIAMKASGINLFRLLLPVLIVSLVLSVFTLIMNDQVLPKTHFAYRKALKNILVKKPLAYLEEGRFIKEFDGYVLFIRKIDDNNVLRNITIYQPQDDRPTRTIIAERGEIITDPKTRTISLKLYNGTSDEPNPDDPSVFYKLDFETFILPPFFVDDSGNISKKTKDMTIDELFFEMKNNRIDLNKEDKNEFMNRLRAEIQKKVAFSFAPFVFTVIGLPLGLITRRGDAVISFGLSLGVITIYYSLFAWVQTLAVQGIVTPWLALWTPNVLLIVVGIALMIKVMNV